MKFYMMAFFLFCVMTVPLSSLADCDAGDYTYFESVDLVMQIVPLTVRITNPGASNNGFGVVIGGKDNDVFIATAGHVVSGDTVAIRFCDDNLAHEYVASLAMRHNRPDVAYLRLTTQDKLTFPRRVSSAPQKQADAGDLYFVGAAQECVVSPRSGSLISVEDEQSVLRASFPVTTGTTGGSSGAPVTDQRGIIGILEDVSDDTPVLRRVSVFSIERVVEAFRSHMVNGWSIQPSCNVPPGSWEAAKSDITVKAETYLFHLNNVIARFEEKKIPASDLKYTITSYSKSFQDLYAIKSKYVGTLRGSNVGGLDAQLEMLIEKTTEIHKGFLNLNKHDLYRKEGLPVPVLEFTRGITPETRILEDEWGDFLKSLELSDD